VVGLNWSWVLGLGLPVLGLHLVSVTLAKALRTYSRSRLEEVCASRRRDARADDVAQHDEATERSAEELAVVTGLLLAALLGALAHGIAPDQTVVLVIGIALAVCAVGYLLAGVIGRVYAEGVIDRLWPASRLLRTATAPLGFGEWLIERLVTNLARPEVGMPRPTSVEVEIPTDGDDAEDVEAEIPESTRALLQHAVDLTQRDVSELMTLRSAIVALPASVSACAAARAFRESGRSRIPLYGENRDDILGILYAKDLFARMTDPDVPARIIPRELVRPAYCIPETKNAFELLDEFRQQRTQIAIVLDEYGGVAGLITLEDLLEELVGIIEDEHDLPTTSDPVIPLGGTRYEVDATLELEELNGRLGLRLPTDGDFLTVGGLAYHTLGRVPEPGATFRFEGVEFTVFEVVDHSIRRVRLELQPTAAVGSQ
jgi:CBS domain containing-hemolysin-like protein